MFCLGRHAKLPHPRAFSPRKSIAPVLARMSSRLESYDWNAAEFSRTARRGARVSVSISRSSVRRGSCSVNPRARFSALVLNAGVSNTCRAASRTRCGDGLSMLRLIPVPDLVIRAETSRLSSVVPATTRGTPRLSAWSWWRQLGHQPRATCRACANAITLRRSAPSAFTPEPVSLKVPTTS
jgi:hypothetical protein